MWKESMNKLKKVKLNARLLLVILVVLLVISQLITFAQDRKILGIKIGGTKQETSTKKSGLPQNEDKRDQSTVCKTISEEQVSELVGKEVTASAFMADTPKPSLFSSCLYRTSSKDNSGKNSRSVTISLQDKGDEQIAKDEMDKLSNQDPEDVDSIEGFGDQAFFAPERNQLTVRKSSKIITVFVKSGDDKALDIEDTARRLAEKLF